MKPSIHIYRGPITYILSVVILLLIFNQSIFGQGQQKHYPQAILTDQPGIVISPFPPGRKLDIRGLDPGSLALDPSAEKIFRIPANAPVTAGNVSGDPVDLSELRQSSQTTQQSNPPLFTDSELRTGNSSTERPRNPGIENVPPQRQEVASFPPENRPAAPQRDANGNYILPDDLAEFLYYFQQSSKDNDPTAALAYFAEPVRSYFGKRNQSHDQITRDRSNYIEKYPDRNYVLIGEPEVLDAEKGVYEVKSRVNYTVRNRGRGVSGSVDGHMVIRSTSQGYKVIAIDETKSGATRPSRLRQEAVQLREEMGDAYVNTETELTLNGIENESSPVEADTTTPQIGLPPASGDVEEFVSAFTAAGQMNEPEACVNFMAPTVARYYNLRSPSADALITNRRNYIRQWPNRKYWLKDKPSIRELGNGVYEVTTRTGYEVSKGSRTVRGTATSQMTILTTEQGFRIASIVEN